MKKKLITLSLLLLLATGCTKADIATITDFAKPTLVISHSGPCINYIGISEGRVLSIQDSDGWQFTQYGSGRRVRISGDALLFEATNEQIRAYQIGGYPQLLNQVYSDSTIVKVPEICK